MAIAYDNSVSGGEDVSSWSHTCSGSDRCLIVAVAARSSNVTGVTYGGVAMTLINSEASAFFDTKMFLLLSPATGSNTVSISGVTGTFYGGSVSYTGVKSGQPDSENSGQASSSSVSVSTNISASNCWLVAAGANALGSSINAGRTSRATGTFYSGNNVFCLEDSNGTVSTGSVSTTFTGNGTNSTIGCVLSLSPGTQTTFIPKITWIN
jgi:hypothetical protein